MAELSPDLLALDLSPQRLLFSMYVAQGNQPTIAAGLAKYKGSKATLGATGCRLIKIDKIKQAIALIQAETMAETGWSIEQSQNKLLQAYALAGCTNQPSAQVSAIVAINRLFGLDKGVLELRPGQVPPEDIDAAVERSKAWANRPVNSPGIARAEPTAGEGSLE